MTNANLKVGPMALDLIHHFEDCRLTAYRDAVGIPTIGWGMTYYPDGRKVKIGDTITQEQADAMFAQVLERDFAAPVRKALGDAPTTPAQFGAMCALAYNIGMGPVVWLPGMKKGFRQSEVLKKHRAGDYAGTSSAFQGWIRAGGQVLAGLVRRRNAEAALYRSDFDALLRYTNGEVGK
ncbi:MULTISPECIES: lysozyme [Sphingomonas]|uniref:lysozyme n=1 Tax=Sphingomonas TaxID=13687 RepID=UPI00254D2F49|nr:MULTISPECIES: lysozyme [Sphingomonas]MDK8188119.1 lysozyme [Sphingomonas zeae]MDK8217884.1 lysozyme [Sphingomonas sp. UMB7805-LC452B]